MTVGLLGYGVSLVLFVLALRGLGAARTGAYFSTAPFMGAAIAVLAFGERPSPTLWLAAVLMGAGVWLHLQERHEHAHTHLPSSIRIATSTTSTTNIPTISIGTAAKRTRTSIRTRC